MIFIPALKKDIQYLYWILIIILLITTVFFLLFNHALQQGSREPMAFDSKAWIEEADLEKRFKYKRRRMREDLTKNHLHVGMEQEEVLELLGDPEKKRKWEVDDTRFRYELGFFSWVGLDTYSLYIEFDDQNVVSDIYVNES